LKQKNIEIRKLREKYAMKGVNLFINRKSRDWWKWTKGNSFQTNSVVSSAINNKDGDQEFDINEKLKILKNHFSALVNSKSEDLIYINEVDTSEIYEITIEEIKSAIKKCRNNKASGNDFIPSELLRYLISDDEVNNFMSFLLKEFNELLRGKQFEKLWCGTDIVAIFKEGDIFDVNNHRGIALVNTILKLFLKIVNTRITDEVEDNFKVSSRMDLERMKKECNR
jgi:hypothetical protein